MNKTIVVIIAVLLAITIGIGTYIIFLLIPSNGENGELPGYVYSTGDKFLTNLKSDGHYIKADILFEVSDKSTLKILEKNNHRIRDRIIEILGDISEDDLNQEDFKKNLRNLIRDDLQNILKIDKIRGVYFNDFIIQ
jgi:flagellar basal body-associated protein FliL